VTVSIKVIHMKVYLADLHDAGGF